MAIDINGMIRKGTTLSVRNVRVIDRTQLRGTTMQTQSAAFRVFQGAEPDYYDASGIVTSQYGYGGNLDLVESNRRVSVSLAQYENGALNKGPITEGTTLLDPRAYFDKRGSSGNVEPTLTTGSGNITILIPSGEIGTYIFQ